MYNVNVFTVSYRLPVTIQSLFAPEPAIRTLANSLLKLLLIGLFASWPIHPLAYLLFGAFVPWNFRALSNFHSP